jgi:putative protein-disulfide isomerase
MKETTAGIIDITVLTDPLCCWSWAFDAQLRQLKEKLAGRASWRYRMAGLIPSWDNFNDQINAVTRPAQMGPVWMHAGQVAGKPICHQLWITDPPSSSYPACIAVKCAQLQSADAGESMLYLLRKACMTEGKNIARQQVLFEVADELAAADPNFDTRRFRTDFTNDTGLEAFRSDLEWASRYRITRLPALIIKPTDAEALIFSGYRPYEEILQALNPAPNEIAT